MLRAKRGINLSWYVFKKLGQTGLKTIKTNIELKPNFKAKIRNSKLQT